MAPSPVPLLLLVTQLERAGAQKVALMQARYFHAQGYPVTLCFFYDKYGLLEEVRQQQPFAVVDLGAKVPGQSWWRNGLRTVRALWRLYRLLRRKRIQVVETLTHYSNVAGLVVAWLARVPVRLASQHNRLIGFPRWFLRLDAWLANSRVVDTVVAVSEQTRRFCIDVEGMDPHTVVVIPNGINLEELERARWSTEELSALRAGLGISPTAQILITVGRFHAQKGYPYLVQAAVGVLECCPDSVFLLVGDGEERVRIEHQIAEAGLCDQVRLLGVRSDVPRLLALSDLFVLPSLYEGMPIVLLEAMAAELPVVATGVDGTREVVVNGETGLLVPTANPEALGKALLTLLEDETLRRRMGQRGCERVQAQFSDQAMCQGYEALIRLLLEEKRGSGSPT